ncbi:hypothetical protein [Snodgrassella alvi]|uniref:hypothetical protein n=1 Tax=Snodgrassella alvi TaxID=1196083 RepID=UPI000C1E54C7|nr:hypothetical protein [Snodgrassella alvi]PIT43376.1 hypothetical protein BHC51_11115 [Snodgrassella alvi]
MNNNRKNFEQYVHNKITAGDYLSEAELSDCVDLFEVRRVTTGETAEIVEVDSILCIGGSYYLLPWREHKYEGLWTSDGNQPELVDNE